jgi:hypothetical protein
MAKAALNMLTRTSAEALSKQVIDSSGFYLDFPKP